MRRLAALVLVIGIAIGGVLAVPVVRGQAAPSVSICDPDGVQASGALYRICMPAPGRWNGGLVVYAHGYIAFNEPLRIPDDRFELPNGEEISVAQIANALGFAFATTSYSTNGLAVRQGVADVRDLVDIFIEKHRRPRRVYLVGGSEGGIVTALTVEKYPRVFDGGVAACGPIGDFRKQIDYIGDFRVVFDYFFPGVIPGDPTDIPQEVIDNWDTVYEPNIIDAVSANPDATEQLLRVTGAPTDKNDPQTVFQTVVGVLWYNVFGTNDAIEKLGGQPFDNTQRVYAGSDNDVGLNQGVRRVAADPAALAEIEAHYQASGRLRSPVITIHTLGDQIIPYWHEPLYRQKVQASGSGSLHVNIPVNRYGHCNFQVSELLAAFALLLLKTDGLELFGIGSNLLESVE